MCADYNDFSLNKGKAGKIDLENLKGGIKREEIKDQKLLAIFDALDDSNQVLDQNEISKLIEMQKKYAKNDNLSKKEANAFLKKIFENNNDGVNRTSGGGQLFNSKDLFDFLKILGESSDNIKSSNVIKEDGHNIVQTEFKDGSIEKINFDEKKRILIKDNKTSTYDSEDNLLVEEYFDKDSNSVKTLFKGGKPQKSTTQFSDNQGSMTIVYEDGKAKEKIVQNNENSERYLYTENGEQLIEKNENVANSSYKKNTKYEYDENGNVTETITQGPQTVKTIKNGEQVVYHSATEKLEDGTTIETINDENGNITQNTLNADNKKIKQVKTIDGKTYSVEYDGNGNTKIVVQNGESIAKIAKIFDVDIEQVKELNVDKLKGKEPKIYFLVGEEIVIPGELEADAKALAGRKSAKDTIGDYKDIIKEKERKQREENEALEEVKNRKPITLTSGQKTFGDLAKQLYKNEGNSNPNELQLKLRIEDLKKLNPEMKDGELKGKRVKATVLDEVFNRILEKQKEVAKINENIKMNREAKNIAEQLYDFCDDNAAAVNKKEFWNILNKIDKNNVVAVLDNYDKVTESHTEDSSLIDTICSEVGASPVNRKNALTHIMNKLSEVAKENGVLDSNIAHAKKEYFDSMQKEFASVGTVEPKNMEKAVDFLRGIISAANLRDKSSEITNQEAMNKFLKGNSSELENGTDIQESSLIGTNKLAQGTYKDAREQEGWVAKTGDAVLGLFGCETISDMDQKLGKYSNDVKKLVQAADAKDEVAFKKLYKEIFSIDFDPKAIQARETAQENYESASIYDSSFKSFSKLENKTKNMNYAGVVNELKQSFKYQDSDVDALIESFGVSKGLDTASEEDKLYVLNQFIKESKQTYLQEYHKISKGKTLEQMNKDLELLTKSAYGTNDIVKDVIQFNENQQMTEMVTSAALEIAGTIALQFVPGLGQIAAAKLAISAANWGVKGIKIANCARKAYKAVNVVSNLQKANKITQVGTQVLNAGVATSTVNLTNKKSVEETFRKAVMNMSFAGVGASSSLLAPKLMQAFGINNKVLANEIAEEIINMAGSYGVTKVSGSDYGAVDGFVDFASGLIISRVSHIKTAKLIDPSKPNEPTKPVEPIKPVEPTKPTSTVEQPSKEKPKKMNILDSNVEIIKAEVNKKGQKVLHSTDGTKYTLDPNDRVVIQQNNIGIKTFDYKSNTDKTPTKTTLKNKQQQTLVEEFKKEDVWITKDYEKGNESVQNINTKEVILNRYIPLKDYPSGAKMPTPEIYVKNLKKEIENCTTISELNNLKDEYNMYNSMYGKTESLFGDFSNKQKMFEHTSSDTFIPHKPKSKFITGTDFDDVLKNFDIKKYGKKGLPLKYSHEDFVKDLKNNIDNLSEVERKSITKLYNIEFVQTPTGAFELSDIPNLSVKPHTDAESNVLDILEKYAKHNELQVSDPALKTQLEDVIKDIPEFSFTIGKAQNGIHTYSLESHTLQNLQKSLKLADKANLSDESKEILKMSVLLHDMGKKYKGHNVSDTGHAILSKKYAEDTLKKFDYSKEKNDKILNLIENHHWFKEFNKGSMNSDDVIKMFGDDLPLAKIMAQADLESVSESFHLEILEPGKKLSQADYDVKIKEKMDSITQIIPAELLGHELPIGKLTNYEPYIFDSKKIDKMILGNNIELNLSDPKLKKLIADLKEGESFAIGCTNPKTTYTDVKYQIGLYENGVASHHVIVTKKHGEIIIEPHKDVTIVKDIPTAKNTNPEIANKIDALRKKASSITSESFIINGKQTSFEILNGTQGGTNKGYYVINKETGELFYAKFGGQQGNTEILASKLYAMAGVDVPELTRFKTTNGSDGLLSKYIPDMTPVNNATSLLHDGFGMDVLLANWDAVCSNNALFAEGGKKVVRIDCGGTFDYRAQGANKPFKSIPTEITTLLNSGVNPTAAGLFSKMTRQDLMQSLQKATALKDSEITKLLDSMGMSHHKENLLKRKKFLSNMLNEMKNTDQGNLSISEYVAKINHSTMSKHIDNAKVLSDLDDIKQALKYTTDASAKQNLLDKIEAKKQHLESANPTPKVQNLSEVQVTNLLTKNGFIIQGDNYYKKLTDVEKNAIIQNYGVSYASTIISKIQSPLTQNDLSKLRKMLNAADGQNISSFQKDMNSTIILYRNLKDSSVFSEMHKMTPAKWQAIFNIVNEKPITADSLSSFQYYKGMGYSPINNGLTLQKANNTPLSLSLHEHVGNLQSYINTQVTKEPMKLYRGEGLGVLASVKLSNGQTLDKAMEEARLAYQQGKGQDAINLLIKEVLSNNYVATQERFMSTSLLEGHCFGGEINWELDVPKGTKGVFLEGINISGQHQSECEFLLQKDSKIVITDIEYNYSSNKWIMKGSASN